MNRRAIWLAVGLVAIGPGLVGVAPSTAAKSIGAEMNQPRIGIVSPMGMEQAPILAAMQGVHSVIIDGYKFYMGTIDGRAVVDVRSGEKEYAAELATTLLDVHFHLTAALLSGTAGSRNADIQVGDVVLGAYVVDKSSIHYESNGSETAYTGVEMMVTGKSLTQTSLVGGLGAVGPTPKDAKSYGSGPSATDPHYVYYTAISGSRALLQTGMQAHLGRVTEADVTGNPKAAGTVGSHVVSGAIGSANQWTEPLIWMEDQNALFQTDAGENEGMGFAYVNAQLGVPSLVVRGISDSPWHPNAYSGVLAADRAAQVTAYIVAHMPKTSTLTATANMTMLSPDSNARLNGYLVANRVFYGPAGTVTKIIYTDTEGKTITVNYPSESIYQKPVG